VGAPAPKVQKKKETDLPKKSVLGGVGPSAGQSHFSSGTPSGKDEKKKWGGQGPGPMLPGKGPENGNAGGGNKKKPSVFPVVILLKQKEGTRFVGTASYLFGHQR